MSFIEKTRRKVSFLLLTNKSFRFMQRLGVHVTPVHFYSPIPDLRELRQKPQLWQGSSTLSGIEMNDALQRSLMTEIFQAYLPECHFPDRPTFCPYDYHTRQPYFGYVSAAAMYSMVRELKPQRIVEVGAGNSTYVLTSAVRRNADEGHEASVTAIDPFPNAVLQRGVPGLTKLIAKPVQDVQMDVFEALEENDVLSIDTSHAVRTGGDVNFLYLDVLPRLKPGVVVHIHDIFLPDEYPREWLERRFFWTEQYLLQAFLVGNADFEVLWGQRYAEKNFVDDYSAAFGGRIGQKENFNSYSFWIRRKSPREFLPTKDQVNQGV